MDPRSLFPRLGMSPIAKALLSVGGLLSVALPIFAVVGFLPSDISGFVFLFLLASLAAAYRPGWILLLLVPVLPLETVNLAPDAFGTDIRPYQFLMTAIFLGLGIRFLARRPMPGWPRLSAADLLLALVPVGSLFASMNASDPGVSLRLSLILFSFYGMYALFRIYVRSSEDVSRILPFVSLSFASTAIVAIAQNVSFLSDGPLPEVMPGRPNAFFAEPDWLGMFLILPFATLSAAGYLIASRSETFRGPFSMKRSVFLWAGFSLCLVASILSVSRSAWLGTAASALVALTLAFSARPIRVGGFMLSMMTAAKLSALFLVLAIPLTDFDLSGRARSVGSGLQTVTVSCVRNVGLPERISDVSELEPLGCRHIDLDEIPTELAAGRSVTEIERDDPNVSIRKDIYARSFSVGMGHPILGVGWGTVTATLGTDGRGTGLNASDVFLETWLGSGLVGLVGLVGFLSLLFIRAFRDFRKTRGTFALFLMAVFSGLVVFDLFNSGILLGFFWALLGIAGSYLSREEPFTETL